MSTGDSFDFAVSVCRRVHQVHDRRLRREGVRLPVAVLSHHESPDGPLFRTLFAILHSGIPQEKPEALQKKKVRLGRPRPPPTPPSNAMTSAMHYFLCCFRNLMFYFKALYSKYIFWSGALFVFRGGRVDKSNMTCRVASLPCANCIKIWKVDIFRRRNHSHVKTLGPAPWFICFSAD